MANPFDQFDVPKANPFDRFDAPAATPAAPVASAPTMMGTGWADVTPDGRMGFASPAQRDGSTREGDLLAEALGERRNMGAGDRMVRSAVRGATSWVPGMDKAVAGIDALTSDRTYQDALLKQRAAGDADKIMNPNSRLTGQGIGLVGLGLAAPTLTVARGAGMGAQMANAAATGGAYGAITGSVESDGGWADKVGAGVVGAGAGAALGMAAPPVIAGLGAAAGFVGNTVATPFRAFRGAMNPDAEAARRVGGALSRDAQADPAAALAQLGPEAVLADTGGTTTRALARSAANTSTEARSTIEKVVNDRFEGQGARVGDTVRGTGASSAGKTLDDLQAQARVENKVRYDPAYKQGESGVMTQALEDVIQAPAVQKAIRDAAEQSRNVMAARGQVPTSTPPVKNPFAEVDGIFQLRPNPDGSRALPSLEFWDKVQQALNSQVSKAYKDGDAFTGNTLRDLRRAIIGELDAVVPQFKAAREGASQAFGAKDALEAGGKYFGSKMSVYDAQKAVGKLSPAEKELFAEGYRTALLEKLSQIDNRRDVTKVLYGSPAQKEQTRIALGPKGAAEIEARFQAEKTMDFLRTAVQGNSTTYRQIVEGGMGGSANSLYNGDFNWHNFSSGAVGGVLLGRAARAGASRVNEQVVRRVADMLMSNDPQVVQRVITQASNSPRIMNAMRAIEDRLGAVIGSSPGQTQGALGLRVGGPQKAGASEDEKPNP